MSTYKEVNGDIFKIVKESDADTYQVLVHGCNCFCNQGAGVALGVKDNFPDAFAADCRTKSGDRSKMGRISMAKCHWEEDRSITVVNAYTQYRYGRGGPHFEYGSLRSCIARACRMLECTHVSTDNDRPYHFIMPMIGSGYAGGEWSVIKEILEECVDFHNIDITVVIYDK